LENAKPNKQSFSFFQTSSKAMAHIDRIYVHKDLINYVYNNELGMGQEISDHDPVFIKIMAKNLPYFRKGLWRLPDEIIKNKKFRETSEKILRSFDKWTSQYMIKECLCESMEEITELIRNEQNPQAKWEENQGRHQRKHHQNNRRRKKEGKKIDKGSQERHGGQSLPITQQQKTKESQRGILVPQKLPN